MILRHARKNKVLHSSDGYNTKALKTAARLLHLPQCAFEAHLLESNLKVVVVVLFLLLFCPQITLLYVYLPTNETLLVQINLLCRELLPNLFVLLAVLSTCVCAWYTHFHSTYCCQLFHV